MANPLFDAIERKQLADLFDELGPDAPTLLEPWTTRDLAAHLVLREHDYLAAPGSSSPVRGAASPNDEEQHWRVRTSPGLLQRFGRDRSNRQYLWIKIFYAASSVAVVSSGRSTSLPFSNFAPARTSATRWGALTARQRDWAASISL